MWDADIDDALAGEEAGHHELLGSLILLGLLRSKGVMALPLATISLGLWLL